MPQSAYQKELEQAERSFRTLFCVPGENDSFGIAPGREVSFLRRLRGAFEAARRLEDSEDGAIYLNDFATGARVGKKNFFHALFDTIVRMGILDELHADNGGENLEFLLTHAARIANGIRIFAQLVSEKDAEAVLPLAQTLAKEFSMLKSERSELLEGIKNADPFASGSVFGYRDGEFVAASRIDPKAPGLFFGFHSVRHAILTHFRDFAEGKSNVPLLLSSLPGHGKTQMVLSHAMRGGDFVLILPTVETLTHGLARLFALLAERKDRKFVVFFDDIDPRECDWYDFCNHVGGAFSPAENILPVLASNYEFPASILSRGRSVRYPVFDEVRCMEVIEEHLLALGMHKAPQNLVLVIAADYTERFGQKEFTELSPRTLMRYLAEFSSDRDRRRRMVERSVSGIINKPDPELFYDFNIELMRKLYGEEYIQNLLKEKLRTL
ncbi:MAG: hypothetical protein PHS41_01095 [Victivallaceae bacterium]|nr:hypothetical protein [Victivallaceae bacterium]